MGLTRAGVLSFQKNGRTVYVKADVRIHLGTPIREEIETANGPVGFKERASTPRLEVTAIKDLNTTLEDLASFSGDTITVVLRDQSRYVFENAWAAGDGVMGAEEHDVALTIYAMSVQENNPNAAA